MLSIRFRRIVPALFAGLVMPLVAAAYAPGTLTVNIGTSRDVDTIVASIVNFLAWSITTVASSMFLVGAFMIVLAGAKEDYKQRGKDLMIGSIMSVAVVLGAYALYRTVAHFLNFVQ